MRTKSEIESEFAAESVLGQFQAFFLVGIGGAGMAPLARMLRARGFVVRGSDSAESEEVIRLRQLGVDVVVGHSAEAVGTEQAFILSDAIPLDDSPEVGFARKRGLPLFRRSQLLNWLLRDKKIIAITGTHGKTTTTGMVGVALQAAGLDPTVVAGAYLLDLDGPVREGLGEWAVVEACEAYDSLRDLTPHHVVLTNLEPDHLDFHGSWEGLQTSLEQFLRRMPDDGVLVYCSDDPGATEISALAHRRIAYSSSDALLEDLNAPGLHNRLNAQAARVVAQLIGAENVDQALKEFKGAERRLQMLGEVDGVAVVDDYAHHPREIEASLKALRERFAGRRLVVTFQPHLYSRTADFLHEFADTLSDADHLVIADIYPAREAPMAGMSSARIAELVRCPCDYVPSRHLLPRFVQSIARQGDVVIGMGAGNISDFAPEFIAERQRNSNPSVVVCFGGDSAEREVSLHSGRAIAVALVRKGYRVRLVDISDVLLSGRSLQFLVGSERPDLAFLAVHGTHAEDGAIQGFFELLHIPYTGSGILASAIAMNKEETKRVLAAYGIRVPHGVCLERGETADVWPGNRLIVKPNAQGSTVGLSFVEDLADLPAALERGWRYSRQVLVEEWVVGMEISVPVLGDQVLPPVEIVPASGRYDFEMKYTPGATEEICPARLDAATTARAQEIALQAHQVLGCEGATRTDMIVLPSGEPVVLEVNTLPGMTPTSLLPKSAQTAGIDFDELCVRILKNALTKTTT